jgi:hypothetical protein
MSYSRIQYFVLAYLHCLVEKEEHMSVQLEQLKKIDGRDHAYDLSVVKLVSEDLDVAVIMVLTGWNEVVKPGPKGENVVREYAVETHKLITDPAVPRTDYMGRKVGFVTLTDLRKGIILVSQSPDFQKHMKNIGMIYGAQERPVHKNGLTDARIFPSDTNIGAETQAFDGTLTLAPGNFKEPKAAIEALLGHSVEETVVHALMGTLAH